MGEIDGDGSSERSACATTDLPFRLACTSGYYNDEGRLSKVLGRNSFWGGTVKQYEALLREWRENPDFDKIEYR